MKNCPVCKHESVILELDGYWRCQNCSAYQKRMNLADKVRQWSEDRSALLRLVLVGLIIMLLVRLLENPKVSLAGGTNPFGFFDLGFHELGHFLFVPLGEFMTVAGGSLLQVLMPLAWMLTFFFKRWYFAATVCLAWLGSSLFGVSVYARDAYLTELPLVSLGNLGDGEASSHDWEFLFAETGNLDPDRINNGADLIKHAGVAALVLAIVFGVVLALVILRTKQLARRKKNEVKDRKTEADSLYPTATKGVLADTAPTVKSTPKQNHPASPEKE